MESKKFNYPVIVFEVTSSNAAGTVLCAAETVKDAFEYLNDNTIFKGYKIKYNKTLYNTTYKSEKEIKCVIIHKFIIGL